MKAMYDMQPEIYSANGNGSSTYRWGVVAVQVTHRMGETEITETKWQCEEVTLWATITRAKIVNKVIEEIWGIDVEAKLLNDYNASLLGILPVEYQTKYSAFLADRKTIKDQINEDCAELGIR